MTKQTLLIKNGKSLYPIAIKDLIYVEVEGNYSILHTTDRKFLIKASLSYIEENLSNFNFLRVHRNFIVNLNKISRIDMTTSVIAILDKIIPMGRKYKDILLGKFILLN